MQKSKTQFEFCSFDIFILDLSLHHKRNDLEGLNSDIYLAVNNGDLIGDILKNVTTVNLLYALGNSDRAVCLVALCLVKTNNECILLISCRLDSLANNVVCRNGHKGSSLIG